MTLKTLAVCLTAKKLKIIKSYGKPSNSRFLAVTPRILEGKIIEATDFMRDQYIKKSLTEDFGRNINTILEQFSLLLQLAEG